jgi:hypothetical protein
MVQSWPTRHAACMEQGRRRRGQESWCERNQGLVRARAMNTGREYQCGGAKRRHRPCARPQASRRDWIMELGGAGAEMVRGAEVGTTEPVKDGCSELPNKTLKLTIGRRARWRPLAA